MSSDVLLYEFNGFTEVVERRPARNPACVYGKWNCYGDYWCIGCQCVEKGDNK